MADTPGERMPWAAVPADLRAAVGEVLGSPIAEARSQPGGFSPGSADRVVTAGGRRAFVKTAYAGLNERSVAIHRQEAATAAWLPLSAHAPGLLGFVDAGEWVALILEDVEGRHPLVPWSASDIAAVLDALCDLARDPLSDDFAGPALGDAASDEFAGWHRLIDRASPPAELGSDLAGWVAARLTALADMSDAAIGDLAGDRLVHRDVRADNILIRPDERVVLVDWPWTARGAGWFDALTLLVNVRLYDRAADVERIIEEHAVFAAMDPDAGTRVLAGLAGFFVEASRREPIPALPTLRRFQLDQGIAALEWLRQRMDGAVPTWFPRAR